MNRYVTGLDENGRSAVISVEPIDGMDVWEDDLLTAPEWVTGRGKLMGFEPNPGQVKVMAVTFPPGDDAPEGAANGLHKTRSVDIVLAREPVTLVLESGNVALEAGDVVVQRATMHDWRNPGDEPARIFGFSWGVAGPDATEA